MRMTLLCLYPILNNCVKRIIQLLDRFTIFSGLKVNHSKTEAMWIGSCRQNTATPLTTAEKFIKQLNTIIYNFLWKGTDKIARQAAANDLELNRSWNIC